MEDVAERMLRSGYAGMTIVARTEWSLVWNASATQWSNGDATRIAPNNAPGIRNPTPRMVCFGEATEGSCLASSKGVLFCTRSRGYLAFGLQNLEYCDLTGMLGNVLYTPAVIG